jgi:AcrR family transcriptional regulator
MSSEDDLQDQAGRALGPRAQSTRRSLLDSTAELLAQHSLREVRVVDIARRVGSSPATFYQYFKDVEDAVLQLAGEASLEMPAILDLMEAPWEEVDGMDRARAIVEAFIEHWDKHHAVLRVRNLASDEGDLRFAAVRAKALSPVLQALAKHIESSKQAGRLRDSLNANAGAAALGAILERLAAYHRELEKLGVSLDELVESSAYMLYRNITGYN